MGTAAMNDEKRPQPILFGTNVASMTIVISRKLICGSRDAEKRLRGGETSIFRASSSERPGAIERVGAYFFASLNFSICFFSSSMDAQPDMYRQIISNVRFVGARPV